MKGGSEVQFTTSLQLDPVDQLDQLDRLVCSKLVFRVRETLLYVLETQKSLYCVFKKYKVYFWEKKAPVGMLGELRACFYVLKTQKEHILCL